jgi:hypothetical protein
MLENLKGINLPSKFQSDYNLPYFVEVEIFYRSGDML